MEERSSSGLDMFDIFLHERNRLRVFEVGRQKIALHLHDLLVALYNHQPKTVDTIVEEPTRQ